MLSEKKILVSWSSGPFKRKLNLHVSLHHFNRKANQYEQKSSKQERKDGFHLVSPEAVIHTNYPGLEPQKLRWLFNIQN